MLTSSRLVGFIASRDFARSKAFYKDTLRLEFVYEDQFAVVFRAGGNTIRISGCAPDFAPPQHTVLGWEVHDIESVASDLIGRGVTFERYGFLEQNAMGIWNAPGGARVAWFKDPDGNLLSISQI